MVYGKSQTSFRLLTEETAIKWRLPVGASPSGATTAGGGIKAGMVVYLNGTLEYALPMPLDTAMANWLVGVAMDEYSSALDETQGSGFLTVILGPHIGNTTQYTTGGSNLIGANINNPLSTIGLMHVAAPSSAVTRVGNILSTDSATAAGTSGTRLTYWWSKT